MTLLKRIRNEVGGPTLDRLSDAVGADRDATRQAVEAALPLLVGGLAKNATASEDDAASLASALDDDHDGALLNHLDGLFGSIPDRAAQGGLGALASMAGSMLGGGADSRSIDGSGILGHVLGNRLRPVEEGIAAVSGLDRTQVRGLLELLAPIVMSVLGQVKSEDGLDASGLASRLDAEREAIETETPKVSQGGLLDLLDREDDGSVIDDVADLGKRFSSLF